MLDRMAAGDPRLGEVDTWRGDTITLTGPGELTPTLYHADASYYSQVACGGWLLRSVVVTLGAGSEAGTG